MIAVFDVLEAWFLVPIPEPKVVLSYASLEILYLLSLIIMVGNGL